MLGYGLFAKGRVDDVGISLKVRKVHTMDDKRRDASGHVEIRDARSCDLLRKHNHMIC